MANNLPTVSSPLPRDLQQFVQRVREALDGGGVDAVLTARKLIATGIVTGTSTGDITPSPSVNSLSEQLNLHGLLQICLYQQHMQV